MMMNNTLGGSGSPAAGGVLRQSFSASEHARSAFPAPGLSDLRILVIDNYDSFTYNLVQYLGEISGTRIHVFRNDEVTVEGIREHGLTHLVVSPGPCTPDDAGVSLDAIAAFGGVCPVLGVCLGHQSIGQVYGGKVIRGEAPVHGKTSLIHHDRHTHLRRTAAALRGHPVPLAGGGPRPAARPGSVGVDAGRGHHGPAPQDVQRGRRAVPPGEPAHRGGERVALQLPQQ